MAKRMFGDCAGQGFLSSPKGVSGTWRSCLATKVTIGTYWIAILRTGDMLKFRDKVGGAVLPSETSAETNLTRLPDPWTTGTVLSKGPLVGYRAEN